MYLDELDAPIDLDSKIEFTEVYALNEHGIRSSRKCVTLEEFYEFLEEETRHLKGTKSHESTEN